MNLHILLVSIFVLALVDKTIGGCPKCDKAGCLQEDVKDNLVRVGDTRFYMFNKDSDLSFYKEAGDICKKAGLKLASIQNIEEDTAVGRWIENWAPTNDFKNTNWWIDAQYSKKSHTYEDADGDEINYQNFIFMNYPINSENFEEHSIAGAEGKDENSPSTCAFVSLPFSYDTFGLQYSWREADCKKTKRRPLCEESAKCDNRKNAWTQERTRYEGVFPLSARKYVISWERRSQEKAGELCAGMGLLLLDLHEEQDLCILNLIKRHRREVTHTNFWTAWKYDLGEREFYDHGGETKGSFGIRITDTRSSAKKKSEKYCVSLLYAFEHQNSCNCPWKFIQTVPSTCDLPNGVICQGTLHKKEPCVYDKVFPLKEGSNTFRSDDKATYLQAEVECRRYGLTLTDHEYIEDVKFDNDYDMGTQYWVYSPKADDDSCDTVEFKKGKDSKWLNTADTCKKFKFFLCAKNKGSSSHSGRSFKATPIDDTIMSSNLKIRGRIRSKYGKFKALNYFVGKKATFKRSKYNCHQRNMELLSADEPEEIEYLENVAAHTNTTFWIYSKHVENANKYRYADDENTHKHGIHDICTTMNRYGIPKASNCRHRHRYICASI